LALFTFALVLIIDINRPTGRANMENQQPMEALRRQLAAQPASAFDRWRVPSPDGKPPPRHAGTAFN
jgi:hypothetical protein